MTVRVSYTCQYCGRFIVEKRPTAHHPGGCPFCRQGADVPVGIA